MKARVALSPLQQAALRDALVNNGVLSPRQTAATCEALERLGLVASMEEDWPILGRVEVWRLTSRGFMTASSLQRAVYLPSGGRSPRVS